MKKFSFLTAMAVMFLATTTFAQTAASVEPPAPVTRANAPQFIVIGSDDNTNAEAIAWMMGVMNGGRNADGSKRHMTFYVNTFNSNQDVFNWENNEELVEAVLNAYKTGHSIGNHTHTHPHFVTSSGNMDMDGIREEITLARDAMAEAGIPVEHQFGFRTPFLAYHNDVFTVLREMGFLYDASIESSVGSLGASNWPYTLDNASPDNAISWWGGPGNPANADNARNTRVGQHPGLWSLLASNVTIAPADRAGATMTEVDGSAQPQTLPNGITLPGYMGPQTWEEEPRVGVWNMTGFDYNLWAGASNGGLSMNENQTFNALMHTLQEHLNGNRAPFAFGPHSQYFFQPDGAFPRIDAEGRRRAFERFVEEASKLENVFFVSGDMVIRWMENPVPASQFKPEDYFVGYGGTACIPNWGPWIQVGETETYYIEERVDANACSEKQTRHVPKQGPTTKMELIGWEGLTWSSYTDNYDIGSDVDFSYPEEGPLTATLTLGTGSATLGWPYIGLGTFGNVEFTNLVGVEIIYTADRDLNMSIGLTVGVLAAEYNVSLTAGTERSASFTLDQFVRAQWPPEGFEGPANLGLADMSNADGITFFHGTAGATVELTVTSIKLVFGEPASIRPQARNAVRAGALQINGFRAGVLNLSVGQAGAYTVSIHDVSGRVLAQTKTNLVAGANSLTIGNNLARGIAIIRIEGANATLVRRVSIR